MKKIIGSVFAILILLIGSFLIFKNNNDSSKFKKIRVAEVAHTIFYAPFYVSIENNYFEDEGLEIDLMLTPGADKVTAAVLSNDSDIGFSGSEACIYVYNNGEADFLKTFAQLTQKDGSFIVSRNKIDNFKLTDLIGKSIIGGRKGGMPEMTFENALKSNNIDPKKDLNIDTSIAFAAMGGAFIGGTGDFVTLFEPTATQIERQGYGYVVASVGEYGGVVPYTSFSTRKSYIENNKSVIESFTIAIQKGLDYVHSHTNEDVANIIINQFPDTSLNDLISAIKRYREIDAWPTTTNFSEDSFNHLQDIMESSNELNSRVSYDELIFNE